MTEFVGKIGTPNEGFTLKIVYEKTNDITNNRTIINSIKGYVKRNNSSYHPYNTTRSSSIKIERQKDDDTWETVKTINGYTTSYSFNSDNYYEWASGDNINISHKTNGSQQMRITFNVDGKLTNYYPIGSISKIITLDQLHQSPKITSVDLVENNTKLTSLSVPNNTIVQYLSNKAFTINATYDNATISNCSIYHNNVLIGTSTTNQVVVDFSKVSELITTETNGTHYVGLTITVTDSKSGYSTRIFNFPVIKYTRPSIEATSTTIKRKTGNGTILTDNIATLNFVGNCYKGDDVVGNANIPTVQYKIWNDTEPDYTTLTTPNTANITISDYQINNIIYTNVYNYKIKIYDIFIDTETITNYKSNKVPTGQSVFSEYKDRVDFFKITQNNIEVPTKNDIQRHIIFLRLFGTTNLSWSAWTDTRVPLELGNVAGTKLLYNSSNNTVTVGEGVSKIRLSGAIRFDAGVATGAISAKIVVTKSDGTLNIPVTTFYAKPNTTVDFTAIVPETLVDVDNGTSIALVFQTGIANNNKGIKDGSILVVEVIE